MNKETTQKAEAGKEKQAVSKIIQSIQAEADYKIRTMEDVLSSKLRELKAENDRIIAEETGIINKEMERNKTLLDNRILAEAELSARRKIEDAREGVVKQAFGDAKALVRKEVESASPAYIAFLKRRGEEAKRIIPSGGTAEVVSGDKAASTLSAMGFRILETLPPTAIGGALFHAPGGEMHLDSTLVHLIQRDMVELRTMASEALFGGTAAPTVKASAPEPVPAAPSIVDAKGGAAENKPAEEKAKPVEEEFEEK